MTDVIEKLGYLASGSLLRRIYEKLQAGGDKVYKDAGLDFKSSWFPVFYVLSKSDAPQTIMDITNQITFSHITVKNITRELQKKQLIKIVSNPNDGRSKLVSLSEKGQDLLKDLQPLWDSFTITLKNVFETGHPDILKFLSNIDNTLDRVPLNQRILNEVGQEYIVRNAKQAEFKEVGNLMVDVYSKLEGFPKPNEQPAYYDMLSKVGELTKNPKTELIVVVSGTEKIMGAVVFFSDMKYYGSGGSATKEKNACGFRLLAVDPDTRGKGIGKLLTAECIKRGKERKLSQLIIHTTMAMQIAWKMYENFGFKRSEDLDFMQEKLPVFGFRYVF